MSDTIGRIAVPVPPSSGLTFPLVSEFGFSQSQAYPTITHRFGSFDEKAYQTFAVGVGPQKFSFRRNVLSYSDRQSLVNFWEETQGSYQTFIYNAPNPDQTTTAYTVIFEHTPLSIDELVNACRTGLTFVEIPDPSSAPAYDIASTCTRFPSDTLATALLADTQIIIPLVTITVRDTNVPTIYLSDRRVTVGGQLYLPRITGIGDPNSGVLMSQTLSSSAQSSGSDNVQFVLGNADRVMSYVSGDCDLKYANISLSLYHVNSGILLNLWSGFVQNFVADGTEKFQLQCSDGLFPIMLQYPISSISRSCWKEFDDGLNCPYTAVHTASNYPAWSSGTTYNIGDTVTSGSYIYSSVVGSNVGNTPISGNNSAFWNILGFVPTFNPVWDIGTAFTAGQIASYNNKTYVAVADSTGITPGTDSTHWQRMMCDFGFDSANGCLFNQMSTYFGGIPALPSTINYRVSIDWGFASKKITSTSIISDTMYGKPLPEVYCFDHSDPLQSFVMQAIPAAFTDVAPAAFAPGSNIGAAQSSLLGIVGLGPIGGYEAESITKNADGYPIVVAPLANGFTNTGFQINSSQNAPVQYPFLQQGLHQVSGNTPAALIGDAFLPLGTSPCTDNPIAGGGGGFSNQLTGAADQIIPYAAGVAFTQLVYENGRSASQPTPQTPDACTLSVPISQGLSGWTFDVDGNRTLTPHITNPFWVATNVWLRAIGLTQTDAGDQLDTFVLNSLMNVDTVSGCAQIADLQVPPIVGEVPSTTYYTPGPNYDTIYTTSVNTATGTITYWPKANGLPNQYTQWITISLAEAVTDGYLIENFTGIGNETQFEFNGVINTYKPTRDWMQEILNTALGYFSFEDGKLKFGIRENASPTSAFTLANTIYNSLRLTTMQTAFEKLILSYADRFYQYQNNTAEYTDKDHAAYYGRQGSPLTARMNSVGCSSLSQALRIVTTRVREEVGGVNQTEWKNSRNASWRTTILALDTSIGDVVSFTNPEIPGLKGICNVSGTAVTWVSSPNTTSEWLDNFLPPGWNDIISDTDPNPLINQTIMIDGQQALITAVASDGNSLTLDTNLGVQSGVPFQVITMPFRITKWQLNRDWSVYIEGKTVTASMYDLDRGPKPIGVAALSAPILYYPEPLGDWCPYEIQAPATDAIWPNEYTFDLAQSYAILADGTPLANIVATGVLPENQFIPNCPPPDVKNGNVVTSNTGGSIPGGVFYRIAICGVDDNGICSPPSEIILVGSDPTTDTNQFVINNIRWPDVAAVTHYAVFVSPDDSLISWQQGGSGTPSSITINGPFQRCTWALPNNNTQIVRLKTKVVSRGGVLGASITTVDPAMHTIYASDCVDVDDIDDWTGRVMIMIGRYLNPPLWASGKAYNPGDQVFDGANIEQCTTGGTSGGSAPAWNLTIGGTTNDNGVIWSNAGEAETCPYETFNIVGFNALSGTFTIDSSQPLNSLLGSAAAYLGDTFVVAFKGYDNSADPYTFTDAGLSNRLNVEGGEAPHSGIIPHTEIGYIFRVIAGTSRGMTTKVVDNGDVFYTLADPIPLDDTSIIIIETPSWEEQVDSSSINNSNPLLQASLVIPTSNYLDTTLLVAGFTVDNQGNESLDDDPSLRMIYIYGVPGKVSGQAVFGMGIGAPQYITPDAGIHYMVRVGVPTNALGTGGKFIECLGNASGFSTLSGLPLIINIDKSSDNGSTWNSIFPSGNPLIISAANTQFEQNTFNDTYNYVNVGDLLRIGLLPGSDTNSINIEVSLRWGISN